MHYHIGMITHERPMVNQSWGQVDNTIIEFHLSETNGLCRARTWAACLTDRDANNYTISRPPFVLRAGHCVPAASFCIYQCTE